MGAAARRSRGGVPISRSIGRAGLPATNMRGGTSDITTAPVATTEPSPIATPGMTMALGPMRHRSPMRVRTPVRPLTVSSDRISAPSPMSVSRPITMLPGSRPSSAACTPIRVRRPKARPRTCRRSAILQHIAAGPRLPRRSGHEPFRNIICLAVAAAGSSRLVRAAEPAGWEGGRADRSCLPRQDAGRKPKTILARPGIFRPANASRERPSRSARTNAAAGLCFRAPTRSGTRSRPAPCCLRGSASS